jgi:hypothetical protein
MHGEGTGEGARAGDARGGPGMNGPITFIVHVSIDEEGDVTAVMDRDDLGVGGVGRRERPELPERREAP